MVLISQDLLLKYASHTKQRTNENDYQYLKRLTHIYLQERSIEEIVRFYFQIYYKTFPCIKVLDRLLHTIVRNVNF